MFPLTFGATVRLIPFAKWLLGMPSSGSQAGEVSSPDPSVLSRLAYDILRLLLF